MSALAGRRVAIVGGSSGIGLATARLAASRGARVAILSRSQTKLDDAARGIDGEVLAIAMDMLVREAADRTFRELGVLDHLVLTAVSDELATRALIRELTNDQVERTFDKLRGFVNVVRAAVPNLREGGSITMVNGAAGSKPPLGFSVLGAASGAIATFGRALALELAPMRVRVNVLTSGVVDTPIIPAARREEVKVWAESDLPARRLGQPEDIAHAIEFMMTNPYLTAQTVTVDGGFVAA